MVRTNVRARRVSGLRLKIAASLAALPLLAAAGFAVPATALAVPPGNNSEVKIADVVQGEVLDESNNPKVCGFYLDFFGFDPLQEGNWRIEAWSGADQPKGTVVLQDHYVADPAGGYRTPAATADPNFYSLADGQYKLFWEGRSDQNEKQKVFKVECAPVPVAKTYLTLVKQVVNGDGGTALATDWTLSATGEGTTISGPGGVAKTEVPAGTYALAESAGPSNYKPSEWDCTAGTLTGASLVLAAGDDATCTITNTYGPPESPAKTYLTLTKLVVNTGGGQATATDWTLTAAAEGKTISGPGGVAKTEVPAGTYALSESDGVASYLQGDWICTGGSLTGSSLVLAAGDDASCTITNTYAPPQAQPAHLTLVKHVVNTGGGTAKATDWTLKAAGTITISGKTGDETVTNAAVPAGTYVLSESGGEDNYGASPWSCTAGTLTPAGLALAAGEDATCTITNTYESEDVGGATGTPTPSESVEGATSQPTATPPATSTTGGSSSNETGLNVGLFLCLAVGILGAILVQTQRRTVRRQSVRRR